MPPLITLCDAINSIFEVARNASSCSRQKWAAVGMLAPWVWFETLCALMCAEPCRLYGALPCLGGRAGGGASCPWACSRPWPARRLAARGRASPTWAADAPPLEQVLDCASADAGSRLPLRADGYVAWRVRTRVGLPVQKKKNQVYHSRFRVHVCKCNSLLIGPCANSAMLKRLEAICSTL